MMKGLYPFLRLLIGPVLVLSCVLSADAWQEQAKPSQDVQTLLGQAQALSKSDKLAEAVAKLQESASTAARARDTVGEAISLQMLSDVYVRLGKTKDAVQAIEAAVPLFKQAKDKAGEAGAWIRLATLQESTGAVAAALTSYRTAAVLQTDIGDKFGAGESTLSVAMLLEDTDPSGALEAAKSARELLDNPERPQWKATALIVLGNMHSSLGHHHEAVRCFVDAANNFHAVGLVSLESEAVGKLAKSYHSVGQYSLAISYYGQALDLAKKVGDKGREGAMLLSLGSVSEELGQHDSAQAHFRNAEKVFTASGDRESRATALQSLGAALLESGKGTDARKVVQESLDIYKEVGNTTGVANCLGTLGQIATTEKDYATAREMLKRSAELFHARQDRYGEATALNAIGGILFEEGEYQTAADRFGEAIVLYEEIGADSSAATSYANRGEAFLKLHRLEESGVCFEKALSRFESVRGGLGSLTDAKSDYLNKRAHVYRQYANLLTLVGRPDESFDVIQKVKARGLLDLLASGGLVAASGLTPAETEQERALKHEADVLSERMLQEGVRNEVGSKARYDALAKELKEAERKLSDFTTSIYARLPGLRTKRMADTATTVECGRLIPDDTAVIEFAVHDTGIVSVVLRKVNGVLTVTGHSREIEFADLQALCSELRKACASPSGDYAFAATALYDALIGPLEKDIVGKQRLIVCPDSCLWDVPFAVLKKADSKFLIDDVEIAYAYSSTSAMSSLSGKSSTSKATKSLLVCANPDFGPSTRFKNLSVMTGPRPIDTPSRPIDQPSRPIDQPSRPIDQPSRPIDQPSRPIDQPSRAIDSLSRAIDSLSRENGTDAGAIRLLPGTQKEADELGKLMETATVLTKGDVQESQVKRIVSDYKYVHFATHGFVNDASPLLSNVILAQPGVESKDDGFLTARELYSLQLQADMVVLSACNTARGEVRSGEGIVGLTWALFVAGCPSQVVSQWAVDDAGTADLMVEFYRGLTTGGSSKGRALRNAAIKTRQASGRSHPYYWAPFILVGDWR